MNLPTLRQLQYLVAVVETTHFGQAAERCFVTQSTLSAGIQELEKLLGTKLLERSKRKVMPTPLGREVARRAQALIEQTSELVELAHHDGAPLSGPLRLGIIPTIGPFLLPKVLPQIRKAYPQLELFIYEEQSADLVAKLEGGELDVGILALPYPLGSLESQVFWQENFLLALPQGHPLCEARHVNTESLPKDELLLLEEGHCLTDHALSACKLEGLRRSAGFQGTSLYTLLQMVAGGQGLTFLPEMAIDGTKRDSGEIVYRPLDEPGPHRRIGMVWRKTYYRKEEMKLFIDVMTAALIKEPLDES
ncbi:MAG: hydrogen peroxide-inducible genes activator [Candidatus Sedimenticola sp. (ex Thyasira tokunagai)]